MDYAKAISEQDGKPMIDRIRHYVGADQDRFDDMIEQFFSNEGRVQDRIMWAMNHIVEAHPVLMDSHIDSFVHFLTPERSDMVRRGILRLMRDVTEIPESVMGEIYAKSYAFLEDPKETIAVRVFATKVLTRIALLLPELNEELIPLVQDVYEMSEKGLKNVTGHALRHLTK